VLRIAKFNEKNLRREVALLGRMQYLIDWAINEPSCCAGYMEFDVDLEQPFPFCHNEIHFALSGKAEYTFTSLPSHMEERTAILEPHDLCLIRYGTLLKWRILERPYRLIYVVMPMPEVPYKPFDEPQ
jgi:hypothetical protein